jgi:hypothetical protein
MRSHVYSLDKVAPCGKAVAMKHMIIAAALLVLALVVSLLVGVFSHVSPAVARLHPGVTSPAYGRSYGISRDC